MKIKIIYFLFLLLSLKVTTSAAAEIQGPIPLKNNLPVDLSPYIQLGEEIEYLAKWTGFPAGTIITRVWNKPKYVNEKKMFLFQAIIETNDFLSIFYPIKSILRSYIEADTSHSRIFTRKEVERDYRANDRVDFDYENKDALGDSKPRILISLIKNNNIENNGFRAIPGRIADPLSFNWLMRSLDFKKPGDRESILIGDRFATGIITLTFEKTETLTIPHVGCFECIVIRPEATTYETNQNLLQVEGNARIWLEKNTKILLRAEADMPIGKASAIITSYHNTDLDKYKVIK